MKKLLTLNLNELNKLAIECQCGTETVIDLMKPVQAPSCCPTCGMHWSQTLIQIPIDSLKHGLQTLAQLAVDPKQPTLSFRVVRRDE